MEFSDKMSECQVLQVTGIIELPSLYEVSAILNIGLRASIERRDDRIVFCLISKWCSLSQPLQCFSLLGDLTFFKSECIQIQLFFCKTKVFRCICNLRNAISVVMQGDLANRIVSLWCPEIEFSPIDSHNQILTRAHNARRM